MVVFKAWIPEYLSWFVGIGLSQRRVSVTFSESSFPKIALVDVYKEKEVQSRKSDWRSQSLQFLLGGKLVPPCMWNVRSHEKTPKVLVMYTCGRSASWSDRQLELSGLGVLGRFPKRSLVNISEHRLVVTRITRLDRPLVLSTIKSIQPVQLWSEKETYAQPKTHLAHQRLHLFQIQLYRRVVGVVVFKVPQQWA